MDELIEMFDITVSEYDSANEETKRLYMMWKEVYKNKDSPSDELIRMIDESFKIYLTEIDFTQGPQEVRLVKLYIHSYFTSDCNVSKIDNALSAYSVIDRILRTP